LDHGSHTVLFSKGEFHPETGRSTRRQWGVTNKYSDTA
jgi:hypothetical protein